MNKLFIDTNIFESKGFNFDQRNILIKLLIENAKNKTGAAAALTSCAAEKKAERPEAPTPPPGGIGGGCDTRGAESGPGLRRRSATKLIHLHPDTVAMTG